MNKLKYTLAILGVVFFMNYVQATDKGKTATLQVAEKVLRKGLTEIDLGLYPGILLMHGLSELVVHNSNKQMLEEAVDLFKKYETNEIQGRGSYICYETGGSGAAYLWWKGKADDLAEQVADGASMMMQSQKRSTEGLMIPHTRNENQVFIDMAFAVTPYLLYAGLPVDNIEYLDYAVYETVELFRILEDKSTGLVHQGRGFQGHDVISHDNWSRGNGWGAFALAILVRDLPESHPKKPEVDALAKKFFTAVLKYQNRDGMWHQEMSDQSSYVETSGTGLLLYGLGIMVEKGLLPKSCRKYIVKGLENYQRYISPDGSVSNTCIGCLCPGKGTKEDYKNREWKMNDPHAFGPVVLAFTQAASLGIANVKMPKSLNLKVNELPANGEAQPEN